LKLLFQEEDDDMKKHMRGGLFCLLLWLLLSGPSGAEDFLGAPVIPGAMPLIKTDARLELQTNLRHDEVVRFYKEALKGLPDIRYREWKEATYIEDDGKKPWHSITISKGAGSQTTVIIVKDNWTWIIGTLLLRFVGVFVVLMVLFIGLAVSGKIISRVVKRMAADEPPGS